ncbi:hypothetical protein V8G54_036352 [Vigna mungo]|uniref:Uncharacterized protein n=1 Tax=Vigna mungo TaxID=3915 RepID=A0AAQ3RFD7_VIGMU
MEDIQLNINWDDVVCPICLDFPHNSVLLQCSSYDNGCRAFVCDTNQLHSNCLDRFKNSSASAENTENSNAKESNDECNLTCPLCRGEVSGWIVVDKARGHLDEKKRCCDEVQCTFMGSYLELQKHAQLEHPHARPSKVDPARQLDWENFQQSSEIIDVLSTIHSEIPRGVVLGDYVIEYGDDDARDEFEDFPGDEEYADYRIEETDDDFVSTSGSSRSSAGYRRCIDFSFFVHFYNSCLYGGLACITFSMFLLVP